MGFWIFLTLCNLMLPVLMEFCPFALRKIMVEDGMDHVAFKVWPGFLSASDTVPKTN
jgi:hypothetical protein